MPKIPILPALLALQVSLPARARDAVGVALSDPVLNRLVEESLAARPEVRQADASARAGQERVPQAGALPDPMVSVGIQNDGFSGIQVGTMATSYYQVMVTQGLPWPGKRAARTDVARLGAQRADAFASRARLGAEADVRRGWIDLLLVRERLALLDRLEVLWRQSAGIVQVRYEAGEAAQSDVLRTQLELNRLQQRRWALQAEERVGVMALNRLRGHPADEPIPTSASIRALGEPVVPEADAALADALDRSPELKAAGLARDRAREQVALARLERRPDIGATAGLMMRGSLQPMWQASLSTTLPVWSGRKQSRALAESEELADAEHDGAEAVAQVLALRVAERRVELASLVDTARLYRSGLLVESAATAESTLAQYRVGKVNFAAVLEANAGWLTDEDGYLTTLADAWRIAIASAEVSLDAAGPGADSAASLASGM